MEVKFVRYTKKVYLESVLGMCIAAALTWIATAILCTDLSGGVSEALAFLSGELPRRGGFPGTEAYFDFALPINATVFTAVLAYSALIAGPIGIGTGLRVPDITIDLKAAFIGVVVGPLAEELICRALLIGLVLRIFSVTSPGGIYAVVVLSSLFFGLAVHADNFRGPWAQRILKMLPHTLMGFVLAFVYLKFGLISAVLLHGTHNAFALIGSKAAGRLMR